MPTVDKYSAWLGGEYAHLTFNINSKGQYYCTLPKVLADHAKKTKVTGLGLNGVKDEVRQIVASYKATHTDSAYRV